uniref:Helicase ATP-binding domain-containing protein n=1 Tax=viral metagenome TaxID=1070528 RepID=A0A6C0DG76_9ZZZZ
MSDDIKNDGRKNPLERITDTLKVKPIVTELDENRTIKIVIPKKEKKDKTGQKRKIEFADDRKLNPDFDIEKLRTELAMNKLGKVTVKETVKLGERKVSPVTEKKEPEPKTAIEVKTTKVKKTTKPKLTLVEEEQDETVYVPEKKPEKEIVLDVEEKPTERKTQKPPKGERVLTEKEMELLDNAKMVERLPPPKQHVDIKVSSYYMNNREIFVNFINSLFQPYREQFMNDTSPVTCESISKQGNGVTLLAHQKLVRDYMNMYTPYRGLLVLHSLGSGKSGTSIALAEGMKSTKKVVIMTPASLRRNYIEEIKKFGDPIYKTSQYWEWISTVDKPELVDALSTALNLSKEYIERKRGAWLVNVKQKQSNIDDLMPPELKSLNEQIDEMIQTKYKFINYNGLRRAKLKEMTNNFETNIFDDAVVVIDEAHNLISRIVNKLEKEKEIPFNNKGKKERVARSLSLILYELLMSASNARIVLLSGTPIINYPNEVAILFNMLRGYIKTWEFPLDVKAGQKVTKESLQEIFKKEKILDYMDYTSNNKKLIVTRNPFGFENRENKDGSYRGVTNSKKESVDKMTGKTVMVDRGAVSDDEFKKNIIHLLGKNGIDVIGSGIIVHMYKALPDTFEDFKNRFIESNTGKMINEELFKRRILGLTSYFKSASEQLLPRYEKAMDYHVIKIPMSDYQFNIYEEARQQERKLEKNTGKNMSVMDKNGIYKESSSTYRIFSRLFCNFVVPRPPGRPFPERKADQTKGDETKEAELRPKLEEIGEETRGEDKKEKKDDSLTKLYSEILTQGEKEKKKKPKEEKGGQDMDVDLDLDEEHGNWEGVVEGDDVIDNMANDPNEKRTYEKRIEATLYYLKEHADEILSPRGLETYSPKYLHMLENIQDEDHPGLHLVYSQFRTLEGIGIFKLVLEQNGFTQFKIKKNTSGIWELDIAEDDRGKPTFALYTGTESAEEKEVIRNIYNSNWNDFEVSAPGMYKELTDIANNNNIGEIIKVLMITASGSEGINLRNTRYVHIMEPYWHPARLDQVIGRARRICSHKDLPEKLQTVEVFVYLMTFTKSQIDSDLSIELKNKDLSKRQYKVVEAGKEGKEGKDKMAYIPLTSDEALFEISTIKEEVTNQLLTAIKESSIDCAVYSKRGSKENLHCIQFGETNPTTFSYNPSILLEQSDTVAKMNKTLVEWKGVEVTISGKKYIYRKMNERLGNLYDYDSYFQALEKPGFEPVMVGTVETNSKGQKVVKKI